MEKPCVMLALTSRQLAASLEQALTGAALAAPCCCEEDARAFLAMRRPDVVICDAPGDGASLSQLQRLRDGVELNDGMTLPAEARLLAEPELWPRNPPVRFRKSVPTSWLELVIREGRNRQVRRMTAAVGLPTLRLVRVRIGPWTLDGLQPGEWKEVPARLR